MLWAEANPGGEKRPLWHHLRKALTASSREWVNGSTPVGRMSPSRRYVKTSGAPQSGQSDVTAFGSASITPPQLLQV